MKRIFSLTCSLLCILFLISMAMMIILPSESTAYSIRYIIKSGDTLYSIAKLYKIDPQSLAAFNNLPLPYQLKANNTILIPTNNKGYIEQNTPITKLLATHTRKKRPWRYIVIHHSATRTGNARSFEYYHRYKRHMQNGMAYHFVITNGVSSPDGFIEPGNRWKKQLAGGHTKSLAMNDLGIGICLVGNFDKTLPTAKQMNALSRLVRALQKECGIPASRVIGHKDVKKAQTRCPGKRFPWTEFKRML